MKNRAAELLLLGTLGVLWALVVLISVDLPISNASLFITLVLVTLSAALAATLRILAPLTTELRTVGVLTAMDPPQAADIASADFDSMLADSRHSQRS